MDTLTLFRTRLRVLAYLVTSLHLHEIWSDNPFLLCTRFGIPNELMLCPSFSGGLEFLIICNFSSFSHKIWNDFPLLFYTRFGFIDTLWLFFSFVWGLKFFSKIDISLLFRTRFRNGFVPLPPVVKNDSWQIILLSSSARGLIFW